MPLPQAPRYTSLRRSVFRRLTLLRPIRIFFSVFISLESNMAEAEASSEKYHHSALRGH